MPTKEYQLSLFGLRVAMRFKRIDKTCPIEKFKRNTLINP
jgi:hypothetical protein